MSSVTVFLNDIDTRISLNCVEDISSATLVHLKYKKPVTGATGYFVGAAYNTIYASYITVDDDLDEVGDWIFQPYVELSGGWQGHGDKAILTVARPL